jgi:hypothetical protein
VRVGISRANRVVQADAFVWLLKHSTAPFAMPTCGD